MAGLFDDNSFKVPPMMGKKAQGKLNKHGYYRMPPNLKGLPAAPKGGLGGAGTMGKKLKAFAKGGLAESLIGEKAKQITGGLGSDILRGGATEKDTGWDDQLTDSTSQQEGEPAATPQDFGAGLESNSPISPKDLSPDETADILKNAREKIAAAQQAYMQNAQDTLAGMQAPKDTSQMAFSANLKSPTGGGFGVELMNGMGAYQGAQADYQKQLAAFNELRARLGMESAAVPLTGAYKDADMAQKAYDQRENRNMRLAIANLKSSSGKPLPQGIQKQLSEAKMNVSLASNISKDMDNFIENLDNGTLNLGPILNQVNSLKNYAGASDTASERFASFKAGMEKMRNDSLRLNKGTQTEGDAQRAWKELFDNFNDQKVVRDRLVEIKGLNERAAGEYKSIADDTAEQYEVKPIDWGKYTDLSSPYITQEKGKGGSDSKPVSKSEMNQAPAQPEKKRLKFDPTTGDFH